MCGIAGILDTRGERPVDEGLLVRMRDVLHHRGPDAAGIHVEPGVGLAHRRLSIIDLSGGQQPLYNEDRSVVVVYNGEIYNFGSLTEELQAAGHAFRTRCDTEVVVHAWEEWGEACVQRFRGMFAFAIWDRNRRVLFLARDRLGIKPLHYALLPDGHLIFGSELKALRVHPGLPLEIETEAVEDFFAYGYVPEPKTIFRHARKLEPGHTMTWTRGGEPPVSRRYWNISFDPVTRGRPEDLERELIERLSEAVHIRLVAEVPLGAFLSGGVDSSAVVALMARHSSTPVNTCSISFPDPRFDESRHAAVVAERYATNHHVEEVNPDDFGLVDRLVSLYDEPYADSSAMPTYRVCELARRRVVVALSGDGGDETFAGYRRHRWHMNEETIRRRLPQAVRGPLFGLLGAVYPKADWAPRPLRAKTTFQALARDSVAAYHHSVSVVSAGLRRRLFSPAFRSGLQGYDALQVFRSHLADGPDRPLSQVQYLDFKTYLPGDILTKVDRASMAHSLEVRVPVLDHEFVEWAAGLSPDLKLRGREGKYVFKRALRPHLPDEILYRDKMGFAVPLASWFRGPLRERVRQAVLGPSLADTGYFDRGELTRLMDQHLSGMRDHSAVIWSLLMFDGFLREPGSR